MLLDHETGSVIEEVSGDAVAIAEIEAEARVDIAEIEAAVEIASIEASTEIAAAAAEEREEISWLVNEITNLRERLLVMEANLLTLQPLSEVVEEPATVEETILIPQSISAETSETEMAATSESVEEKTEIRRRVRLI